MVAESWLIKLRHLQYARYFPELQQLNSEDERVLVWKAARRQHRARLVLLGFVMPYFAAVAFVVATATRYVPAFFMTGFGRVLWLWLGILLVLALPFSGLSGGILLSRKVLRTSLRRILNERGCPICVKCGYPLIRSDSTCPECGSQCDPQDMS